jgi:hypothetical protein
MAREAVELVSHRLDFDELGDPAFVGRDKGGSGEYLPLRR